MEGGTDAREKENAASGALDTAEEALVDAFFARGWDRCDGTAVAGIEAERSGRSGARVCGWDSCGVCCSPFFRFRVLPWVRSLILARELDV